MINVNVDVLNSVFGFIDEMFTTDEERSNAKLRAMELASAGDLAQVGANSAEAQNPNVFVSGWRPAIGWTCGLAFLWAFLLSPVVETVAFYAFALNGTEIDLSGLPELDLATMMPVLMGMLGLGSLRTWEKSKGVDRK